jgi:hypothetical protein
VAAIDNDIVSRIEIRIAVKKTGTEKEARIRIIEVARIKGIVIAIRGDSGAAVIVGSNGGPRPRVAAGQRGHPDQ